MDYELMERQVDWLLLKVLPRFAMIVCGVAGLYFGIHLIVALAKGWL